MLLCSINNLYCFIGQSHWAYIFNCLAWVDFEVCVCLMQVEWFCQLTLTFYRAWRDCTSFTIIIIKNHYFWLTRQFKASLRALKPCELSFFGFYRLNIALLFVGAGEILKNDSRWVDHTAFQVSNVFSQSFHLPLTSMRELLIEI